MGRCSRENRVGLGYVCCGKRKRRDNQACGCLRAADSIGGGQATAATRREHTDAGLAMSSAR